MISSKSKKIIIIFTTLIVLVLLLFATAWKASNSRYPYSPETRVVNSGQEMFSRYYPPSMETNLCYADAVVRGIVTSNGQAVNEIVLPDGSTATSIGMNYEFTVTETLLGETDNDQITIRFWGDETFGCPKPHKNDELILFLYLQPLSGAYMPVDNEYSIFAIMPNVTLYAFSDGFPYLDGESADTIYSEILDAAFNIQSNPEIYEDTPIYSEDCILPELLDPQSDILAPLESIFESAS